MGHDEMKSASGIVLWTKHSQAFALAALFTITFCVSFALFYSFHAKKEEIQDQPEMNLPLPDAVLIDEADRVSPNSALRTGKLILVFVTPDCKACLKEAEFLREVVRKRPDIPIYGIIPFGDKDRALQEAKAHFPFKVFYDQNQHLAAKIGINRVPIKLFVEDGTIKRGWGGAMIQQARKERFLRWLEKI